MSSDTTSNDTPSKRILNPKDVAKIKELMTVKSEIPTPEVKPIYFSSLSKRVVTFAGNETIHEEISPGEGTSRIRSPPQKIVKKYSASKLSPKKPFSAINPKLLKERLQSHLMKESSESETRRCPCGKPPADCRCLKPMPKCGTKTNQGQLGIRIAAQLHSNLPLIAKTQPPKSTSTDIPGQDCLKPPSLQQRLANAPHFSGFCQPTVTNIFIAEKQQGSSGNISQITENITKPSEIVIESEIVVKTNKNRTPQPDMLLNSTKYGSCPSYSFSPCFARQPWPICKQDPGNGIPTQSPKQGVFPCQKPLNKEVVSSPPPTPPPPHPSPPPHPLPTKKESEEPTDIASFPSISSCAAAVRRYPMTSTRNLDDNLTKNDGRKALDEFKMNKDLEKQKMYENVMREEILRKALEDCKRKKIEDKVAQKCASYSPWDNGLPRKEKYPFLSCCGACNLYPGVLAIAIGMIIAGAAGLIMLLFNSKSFNKIYGFGWQFLLMLAFIVVAGSIMLGLFLLFAALMDNGAVLMIWFLAALILFVLALLLSIVMLFNGCGRDYRLNANGGARGDKSGENVNAVRIDYAYEDDEFYVDENLCRAENTTMNKSGQLHHNEDKIYANLACSFALLMLLLTLALVPYGLWVVASYFYYRFMRRAMYVAKAKCKCHSRIYDVKCECHGP